LLAESLWVRMTHTALGIVLSNVQTRRWKIGSCVSFFLLAASSYSVLFARQPSPQNPRPDAAKSSSQNSGQNNKKPLAETPAQLERRRALHALNRLTFGPRPGEVDKVLAKGVDSWIEDQLHPESIEDGALPSHLSAYRALTLRAQELAQTFPTDTMIRQIIAGKRPMPTDPTQKLIYEVFVAKLRQQMAQQDAAKTSAVPAKEAEKPSPESKRDEGNAADKTKDKPAESAPQERAEPTPQEKARALADSLLELPNNKRMEALMKAPPEELINFPDQLSGDQRNRLNAGFSPREREILRALSNPVGVVSYELQQAKVVRATFSERQLQEVMTDFWINHFNVYLNKSNQAPIYTVSYERDVIRPRALGKFRDLLVSTAQSPAMLNYLDNWLSIGPHSVVAEKNKNQSGLNENYGRELMELHTLGVDGGYTQNDVTELARVLTGWTIAQPEDGGQFQFDPKRHEPGNKTVLKQIIYDSGQQEGMHVLDMFAHSASTAHFVSKKLAERFVADNPPESLLKKMAATFQDSDGDIREVLRTLFKSPEFWSPQYENNKLKTPLEFLVSVLRTSGTEMDAPDVVTQTLAQMGMQPYGQAVPTGYSMMAETWETEGALLARINFVTALTQGKLNGLKFDPGNLLTLAIFDDPDMPRTKTVLLGKHSSMDLAIALSQDALLPGGISAKDQAIIEKQLADPEVQRQIAASPEVGLRLVAGFLLASPEFQNR
jgi:Protein of unknown function (DUF1800)